MSTLSTSIDSSCEDGLGATQMLVGAAVGRKVPRLDTELSVLGRESVDAEGDCSISSQPIDSCVADESQTSAVVTESGQKRNDPSADRLGTGGNEAEQRPNMAQPDERLPINPKQVFKLKMSWKGVRRDLGPTGIEMFYRLFQIPQAMAVFTNFAGFESKPYDELRYNEALEAHSSAVMAVFDDLFTHIDDVDYVIQVCEQMAQSHASRSGFNGPMFKLMRDPFLQAVARTLGDRYSDYMAQTYEAAIDFLLGEMVKAFPR